jgi:PQQ-like domain
VSAVQRSTGTGAQVAFLVQTNWAEFRFSLKRKGVNPYENVLSPATVGDIDLHWSFPTESFVFSSPAVANGVVYVGSYDDNVYAADLTGGAMAEKFKAPSRPDLRLLKPNLKLQPSLPATDVASRSEDVVE